MSVWHLTARSTSGAVASASIAASPDGGYVVRLRQLHANVGGSGAGTAQFVVRDGPSASGAIIFQTDLYPVANGRDHIELSGLDIRASGGSQLTIEFTAGVTSDFESVNAQGDYVSAQEPYGI